jgi:predicted TIM-barrel fold metal-dependent hydrolase
MIDCDVHQNYNSLRDLVPWLDPAFREYVEVGGYTGYQVPNYPWVHPSGFTMNESFPAGGGVPGSDYETLREQVIDRFDMEYVVLTGEDILNVSAMAHPQLASALAAAYNRWLVEEWLPKDPRLRGSMVVATQDAEAAAAEIRRHADNDRIVQVLVCGGARTGYGDPHYLPIWTAAAECDLPLGIHAGAEGIGLNGAATATGYPTYYIEYHTLAPTTGQTHLVSLVCHGVFERLQDFRLAIIEYGTCWLPGLMWRLDAEWKALRMEVPWVKRRPSDVVRERVRLTTQPLEEPDRPDKLHALLGSFDGIEDMLMFATDYPHWDVDVPRQIERRLPKAWREKVMGENARAFYRLPARVLEPA